MHAHAQAIQITLGFQLKIQQKRKNKVFLNFDLEDVVCANFHGHICNQQIKLRRYTKFQSDRRYLAFVSTPRVLFKILLKYEWKLLLYSIAKGRGTSVQLSTKTADSRLKTVFHVRRLSNENAVLYEFRGHSISSLSNICLGLWRSQIRCIPHHTAPSSLLRHYCALRWVEKNQILEIEFGSVEKQYIGTLRKV